MNMNAKPTYSAPEANEKADVHILDIATIIRHRPQDLSPEDKEEVTEKILKIMDQTDDKVILIQQKMCTEYAEAKEKQLREMTALINSVGLSESITPGELLEMRRSMSSFIFRKELMALVELAEHKSRNGF